MRDLVTIVHDLSAAITKNNDMTPELQLKLNTLANQYLWSPPECYSRSYWEKLGDILAFHFPQDHPHATEYLTILHHIPVSEKLSCTIS